jgi:hypothetical protein
MTAPRPMKLAMLGLWFQLGMLWDNLNSLLKKLGFSDGESDRRFLASWSLATHRYSNLDEPDIDPSNAHSFLDAEID